MTSMLMSPLSIALVAFGTLGQPCTDYQCDTTVVRSILDANGLDTVPVSSVSDSGEGRVTGVVLWDWAPLTGPELSLDTLLPSIGRIGRLTRLGLCGSHLTVLPVELCQLVDLQRLNLHQNRLTRLPDEIGRLSALRMLAVSMNQLTALPDSIILLGNLLGGGLFINDNSLCSVSQDLGLWLDSAASLGAYWRDFQSCSGQASPQRPGGRADHDGLGIWALRVSGSSYRILYSLPGSGSVRLTVRDLAGRVQVTLVEGKQQAGTHVTPWQPGPCRGGVWCITISLDTGGFRQVAMVRAVLFR